VKAGSGTVSDATTAAYTLVYQTATHIAKATLTITPPMTPNLRWHHVFEASPTVVSGVRGNTVSGFTQPPVEDVLGLTALPAVNAGSGTVSIATWRQLHADLQTAPAPSPRR